ncbi:MAG: metallopeptidase TldD-related protein, partial [Mariprofundaceae bacterium]|nr:metallopeptidase TldD-related protein [Mariprofundaceae bacterium]
AIHADALSIIDTGESIDVRHGKLESIEREDSRGVGLRAFIETSKGLAFASASTSDVSEKGLKLLAKQVVNMANISEPDPDAMPPEGAEHPSENELAAWRKKYPHQPHGWTTEQAKEASLSCEAAALAYSDKISNSEGASASFGETAIAYAASDGFVADYERASSSLSISVIAGEGESMQRDYAYTRARQASKLRSPAEVGQEASERTLRLLGASGLSSRTTNVVFEPRIATSILGHLISAINGRAILQKRSFLNDDVNKKLFPDFIHISDNPDHADGMGNRLFDGEGTHCKAHNIIEAGTLTGFLTDRYAAKRLGTCPTGHARRGLTGDTGIGTSNLILQPGTENLDAILHDIGDGVLITELMGFGINGVTGDYSRGASGFLIENGKISRPVQAFTIAGNLRNMFAEISHIGNDLTWFGATATPSIAIANMTIAG